MNYSDDRQEAMYEMFYLASTSKPMIETLGRIAEHYKKKWMLAIIEKVFRARCRMHDAAFEYSDDHSVWRAGSLDLACLGEFVAVFGRWIDCKSIWEEIMADKYKHPDMVPFPFTNNFCEESVNVE